MLKGLVIGLGFISEAQLLEAKKIDFKFCFACGPAINLTKNLKIKKRILFLSEARLAGNNNNFWDKISARRNEKQIYNQKASELIDFTIPNEIWIFNNKSLLSKNDVYRKIKEKRFKGKIKIYTIRSLIFDIISLLGFRALFIDNKKISIIDLFLSLLLNKKIKRFGLKIPSGGVISILACLKKTNLVYILGISLDRRFGYVNNKRYDYPMKGRNSHITIDGEVLKRLGSQIKKFN